MKTPVNKRSLQLMKTYSWWKFAFIIIGAAVFWNLFFTVTAYRSPPHLKVDFYAATTGNEPAIREYLEQVHQTEMSDMEEMNFVFLTTESYYGDLQLSTYIAAQEGDVYMLPSVQFQNYAANGAMLPLEEDAELLEYCRRAGIALDKGWRTNTDTHERHLYGIPADKLTGLQDRLYMGIADRYLCVIVNNGNDENSFKLLRILVRDMAPGAATGTDLSATGTDLSAPE